MSANLPNRSRKASACTGSPKQNCSSSCHPGPSPGFDAAFAVEGHGENLRGSGQSHSSWLRRVGKVAVLAFLALRRAAIIVPMWKASFKVGSRLCEMTFHPATGGVTCEWTPPDTPFPCGLREDEREQYLAGRNALLHRYAQATGGRVVIFSHLGPLPFGGSDRFPP